MGPILWRKVGAAALGGLTGILAGSALGIIGTLVQTGRLSGAFQNASQARRLTSYTPPPPPRGPKIKYFNYFGLSDAFCG